MCGIAGYNVSEEWKAEFITPEVQKAVLQEAWLHNLHRGNDAAGYFALKDDGGVKVYKKNSDAATLLKKNLKRTQVPPARVFGAHTRAMTQGDAKVAANNHPVYYDGVWVTHNGTIRNDGEIRKSVADLKKRSKLAEVDSIAIPIRLADVETPMDVESVVTAVSKLTGGYAFHAVWREHPGMSLLARGTSSPLMVAQHDFGGVFYASEVEALWGMIHAMNLDPASEQWNYYSMQDHSAIVVFDGEPVAWADYDHRDTTEIVSRVLPKGHDGTPQIVYTSKGKNDFPQKHGAAGRDLDLVAKTELIYTLEGGAVKSIDKYPRHSDTDSLASLSEADKIILNKASGNRHVFFGDIELIVSGRVLLDVYDHSKFTTDRRWFVDPIIDEPLDTFDDFLKAKGTKVLQTPDPKVGYKYDRKADVIPFDRLPGTNNYGGKTVLSSKTEGLQYIKPNPILTWNNIWNLATDHKDMKHSKDGFVFQGHKLRCSQHNDVLMQDHPDPQQCGYAKASAAYMLSCAPDLEILTALMPSAKIREEESKKPCPMGKHDIHGTVYFEIILASDRYFEVLIEEECMDCGSRWRLDDVPFWLLGIVGGRKDLLVGYGNQ